jgi:23S rRNA pseudouridine2605 synthase
VSRKEVERSIRSGGVTLFGKVITTSAALVPVSDLFQPHNSAALVLNGKTVPISPPDDESHPLSPTAPSRVRVWLVHKMAGELVTDVDPFKRPTVMTRVAKLGKERGTKQRKEHREHIKAIGRLDMNTEGLLVVTNCGAYARDLEFARNHVHRTYRVRVHGKWQPYKLHALRNGTVVSEGVRYPPMRVTMETTRKRTAATNQWIQITCAQGRNRQIRKALQQLQLTVTRLIRVSYGDYQLTGIPKGMVKEVPVIPLAEHKHRGAIRRAPRSKDGRSLASPDANGSAVKPAPVQWVRMKK